MEEISLGGAHDSPQAGKQEKEAGSRRRGPGAGGPHVGADRLVQSETSGTGASIMT